MERVNETRLITDTPLNPGLLSDYATEIFKIVNYAVLSSAISVIGIVANSLNMCVLVRQGFSNSMNISFFGMAISDMGSLVTLLWLNACLSPLIGSFFNEVHYLFGAWLHGCSARITGWITVYVTAERYLSIARPLKVKDMVTPGRTVAVIVVIYTVNLMTLVPEVSTIYFDWKTVTGQKRIWNDESAHVSGEGLTVEGLVFAVHATLTLMSFIGLVTLTTVLVAKIRQKSLWRKTASSSSGNAQQSSMSTRDRKTITLVITVSMLLIVCYVPTVTFSIVTTCVPAFSLKGEESNVFYVAWSFAFITHSVNSSVIVLLYYRMSSRYRATFNEIVGKCFVVGSRGKGGVNNADGNVDESIVKY